MSVQDFIDLVKNTKTTYFTYDLDDEDLSAEEFKTKLLDKLSKISCETSGLESLVIKQGDILREISLIVKGDEPENLRWGVHDLTDILRKYNLRSLSNQYKCVANQSLNMPEGLKDKYLFASWLLEAEFIALRENLLENIDTNTLEN